MTLEMIASDKKNQNDAFCLWLFTAYESLSKAQTRDLISYVEALNSEIADLKSKIYRESLQERPEGM